MTDQEFSYEDDTHTYRNAAGIVCPSVTGALKNAGCIDYSRVDPELLERKRLLGQRLHEWTADHDRFGCADPMALTEEEMGGAKAWLRFKEDFRPQFLRVEHPMLRTVGGHEVGGTPDAVGFMMRKLWVIDKKWCSAVMPAWKLQTALYELLLTGHDTVGVYGRMSVRLGMDGKYFPTVYADGADAAVGIAAVALAHNPDDEHARATVEAWKYNHGLA